MNTMKNGQTESYFRDGEKVTVTYWADGSSVVMEEPVDYWFCCNDWDQSKIMCDECLERYYSNMSDFEDDRDCYGIVRKIEPGQEDGYDWIWDGECSCGNIHPSAWEMYTPRQKGYSSEHLDNPDYMPF